MKNQLLRTDNLSIGESIVYCLEAKCSDQTISRLYRRDLQNRSEKLLQFLIGRDLFDLMPDQVPAYQYQLFMDGFTQSNTYYNNVKRDLGALFQFGVRRGVLPDNPFRAIAFKQSVEVKNIPFEKVELRRLIRFLDGLGRFKELRICIDLIYFSLLRPHEEIRLLKKSDFNDSFSRIIIPGTRVKNSKTRVVDVNEGTKQLLLEMKIADLDSECNIWSRKVKPFNPSYFNNQWRKLRELDQKLAQDPNYRHQRIIGKGQTLYSIRHNAAIAFYQKVEEIGALQRIMAHNNVATTENYLRNLGVLSTQNTKVPSYFD